MTAPTTAPAPTPPKPFTLADVTSGKRQQAYRLLLSGVEGIGKSTFGADAPSPIFLGAEDGTDHLDVKRLPAPRSWADVFRSVALLQAEKHDFKTLVVDTVDWLEPLCWDSVCARDKKKDIEDYGFGKGYTAALDEWRKLLRALEGLRAKGMHVVLLAHTHLKTFKNPLGDDFDRYELKLNLKAGGLLKEWCDAVLFANYETFTVKSQGAQKAKGVSSGARYVYTERTAAYDAKNRYGLPAQLALSWAEFDAAARGGADPKTLLEAIHAGLPLLSEADRSKVLSKIPIANGDATRLSQILNFVAAKTPNKESANV